MFMHFFRPQAARFFSIGERRFLFDAIGDEAGKIGDLLRSKESEAKQKNNAEKLNELDAIREQAHLAMHDTSKEMTHMQFFATRTNIFLGAEGAEIDKKEARVLVEMLKPEYIKVLIEKAQWQKAPELVKTGLPEVIAILKTGKETILPRIHGNLDAFLQNPKGQLKKFILALNANTEFQGKKFTTDDPQVMLLTLLDAEWIDGDQKTKAEEAFAKSSPAPAAPEKKNVEGKPMEGWRYLSENRTLMLQVLKLPLKAFMENPQDNWRQLLNAMNVYAQNAGSTVQIFAGDEEAVVKLLLKASWIEPDQARDIRELLKEPIPTAQRPVVPPVANVVPPKQVQRPAETPIQTNPQRPPIPEKPQWQQVPRETDPVGDSDLTRFVRGKEYEVGVARIITIWNPTTKKNLAIDSSEFKDPVALGKKLKGTGIRVTPKAMAAGYTIEFCYPGRYYVSMSNGRLAGTPQLVTVSPSDLPGAPIVTPKQEQQPRGGNRQPTISNAPNPTPLEETVQEETLPPSTPVRPTIPGSKGMDTPPPPTEQEERVPGSAPQQQNRAPSAPSYVPPRQTNVQPPASSSAQDETLPPPKAVRPNVSGNRGSEGGKRYESASEQRTSVEKMQQELQEKFDDLIQAPLFVTREDGFREEWRQRVDIANPAERLDAMRAYIARMEAILSGDRMKEVTNRPDVYTVTIPLSHEDVIVIYPKAEGPDSRNSMVYYPGTRTWSGTIAPEVARRHGVWATLDDMTHGNGSTTADSITVHFTENSPYVVMKRGWRGDKDFYDPAREGRKMKEAKKETKGPTEWKSIPSGDKGYKYWFDRRTNTLYANKDGSDEYQMYNSVSGKWSRIAPEQMTAAKEAAPDPAKEEKKILDAKQNAKDKWNFSLETAVANTDTGKKFGYFFDTKEGVVYATDPDHVRFSYWNEDTNLWEKIPKSKVSDEAVSALEVAKVEKNRNKPKKLGGTGAREDLPQKPKLESAKEESEKKTISPEKAKEQFDALWKKWESLKKETDTVLTGKTEPQSKRLKIEAEEQVLGQFFQEEAFQEPQFADRMGQIQKRIEKLRAERKTLDM